MKIFFRLLIAALLPPLAASAQVTSAGEQISRLLAGKQLRAGIALCDLQSGEVYSLRGDKRFAMMSVFKFPLALAVLHEADNGHSQIGDTIHIHKSDLPTATWSPLRDRYPEGATITLAKLIGYTVAQSDNNGCDVLLRMIGGPTRLDTYIRTLGIDSIRIARTEADMHRDPESIYDNWATPHALLQLLQRFHSGKLLSPSMQAFMWNTLASTSTGSVRSLLPDEVVVAHKTGSSGRYAQGIAPATNDAGILCMPDGRQVAYVILLADSAESDAVTYELIAQSASILYDVYTKTPTHE